MKSDHLEAEYRAFISSKIEELGRVLAQGQVSDEHLLPILVRIGKELILRSQSWGDSSIPTGHLDDSSLIRLGDMKQGKHFRMMAYQNGEMKRVYNTPFPEIESIREYASFLSRRKMDVYVYRAIETVSVGDGSFDIIGLDESNDE